LDFWLFVLLVTIVGCSIPLYKLWLDHQREINVSAGDPDELRREIAALESRVQVLEAIVTDKTYDLRQELDALDRTGS